MQWLVLACLVGVTCASAIHPYLNEVRGQEKQEWLQTLSAISRADLEDAHLTFVQLITKYGYPVEEHFVTTEDGYVLAIHRIPHGRNVPANKKRGVAFVQHGILSSSIDWAIPGPEKGIAYMLADRGYDVWLGNARGNTFSKNHTSKDVGEKEFWNFSWHEIGAIDLPTMIDYVLEKTGEKKVHYVGHSQGTTAFYVMASVKPEYNDKIKAQYSLAPIAYMNHMTSPLMQLLSKAEGGLEFILNLIGMHEFLPTDGFLHEMAKFFCEDGILQALCSNSLFVVCGFNKEQFNATLLPILMGHTPGGASSKQLLHYAQLVNSGGLITKGKFRQYDYGFFGNKARYGQSSPPNYDLGKITAPVYLFYSHNDWLSSEKDVNRLYKELGNVQGKFLNVDKNFNHLDYVFGIDADTLVYDKVFSTMLWH